MINKRLTILSKVSFVALVLTFALYSCTNIDNKTKQPDTINVDTTKETSISVEKKILKYPLPTPFEITKMLNEAGAGYILGILNSPGNVDKYETERSRALNLGVYGADLSYSSTFNQTEEMMHFIKSAQKLTEDIGVVGGLNLETVKNIETQIENKDSLYQIITHTFYSTFDYLNNNSRGTISVLVLTGGWIEGLYISTQLAATAQNKEKVIKGIAKQKNTLLTLIATLNEYKDNADIAEVIIDISKLNEIFAKSDGITLTDEQVNSITTQVEKIRKKIIE